MAIDVLGPLLHACGLTGGCCQGHFVHVGAADAARVTALAPELGVADPIVDGELRRVGNRCVFLGEDERCRIHSRFGEAAKPTACRQYPLVAIRAEGAVRVGVDPGCLSGWRTWRDGPELEVDRLVATQRPLRDDLLDVEQSIVDLADELSAPELLARIVGSVPTFLGRFIARAHAGRLAERLTHADTAPAFRVRLAATAARLAALDPASIPEFTLAPEADALVREAVRRVVWLRLVHRVEQPAGAAALTLAGAALVGFAHREVEAFGPPFAAWTRVMRAPEVIPIVLGHEGS